MTAIGFDTDLTYMLVEIAGDQMNFQTLTRSGKRIDSGTITRGRARDAVSPLVHACQQGHPHAIPPSFVDPIRRADARSRRDRGGGVRPGR